VFIEANDDGGGGDNDVDRRPCSDSHHVTAPYKLALYYYYYYYWTYKSCKAHHQQTNIQFFYRPDALPVIQPTVSKHWRTKYHIPWTCLPKLTWGLPTLSLTTNSSWLPWGRVAMPLISPLMTYPIADDISVVV